LPHTSPGVCKYVAISLKMFPEGPYTMNVGDPDPVAAAAGDGVTQTVATVWVATCMKNLSVSPGSPIVSVVTLSPRLKLAAAISGVETGAYTKNRYGPRFMKPPSVETVIVNCPLAGAVNGPVPGPAVSAVPGVVLIAASAFPLASRATSWSVFPGVLVYCANRLYVAPGLPFTLKTSRS
jgi:hypothetical protein